MSALPDTTSRKSPRRWPEHALAVMGIAAVLLVAVGIARDWGFSPGKELMAPGFADIAVSQEDTLYPPTDVLVFDERPRVVYVYVAVKNLADRTDVQARVERSGTGSALAPLFPGGGIRVLDERDEHLAPSAGGVSGVLKFEIRPTDGGRLPAGNYTVGLHEAEQNRPVARKYFVIHR